MLHTKCAANTCLQLHNFEWFGDKITCGTWKDIWLNEGFATYMASLVIENFDGTAAFVADKTNMINSITSQTGGAVYLTDAEAFHKAIAVAREPEKFAKFFYEKGKADQTVEIEKDSKNIDMVRNAPKSVPTDGPKVRVLDDNGGTGLRFRKR